MKSLLIKLFFRDKFIGQIAAAAAAYAASLILSFLPNAPEFVTGLVAALLQLPDGAELTTAGITAVLTPLIMVAITSITQNLVAADNNKLLKVAKAEGVYDGPLDSWVGPKALEGIAKVLNK
jgi:hypothetical protein